MVTTSPGTVPHPDTEAHKEGVWSVAVSPEGKHVTSGSRDKTVRVWDLPKAVADYMAKAAAVKVAEEASDKEKVAVDKATGAKATEEDKEAAEKAKEAREKADREKAAAEKVVAEGYEVHKLEGHTGLVHSVAVSPDGQYVVSGSEDKTVRVWRLSKGRAVRTLKWHTDCVYSVAVSPDGQHIVSGSRDNTVRISRLANGQQVRVLEDTKGTHRGYNKVYSVAWTPDGQHIVTAQEDGNVRVWHTGLKAAPPDEREKPAAPTGEESGAAAVETDAAEAEEPCIVEVA